MDDDRLMEDMNPQSIEILLDMGYELPSIMLALRALRDSSSNRKTGYNPVGEV
jgi:alpha-tubulin suppressor-like RCC1 family protein